MLVIYCSPFVVESLPLSNAITRPGNQSETKTKRYVEKETKRETTGRKNEKNETQKRDIQISFLSKRLFRRG
jgi:hypothetical protein